MKKIFFYIIAIIAVSFTISIMLTKNVEINEVSTEEVEKVENNFIKLLHLITLYMFIRLEYRCAADLFPNSLSLTLAFALVTDCDEASRIMVISLGLNPIYVRIQTLNSCSPIFLFCNKREFSLGK